MLLSLDSGATVSVMSSRMMAKHGLNIIPSDIRVKVANNNVSKVVGVTELLSVEVQGHACKISFIIMDHEDHDALLGLDWFNETGACLCPATKTLPFPSEKIILMSEGNEVEPSYDEKVMVITDSEGDEITNDIDWEEERKKEPEPVKKTDQRTRGEV